MLAPMSYQQPTPLNADLAQPVVVDSSALPWVPSPQAGVERRLLERDGGAIARASEIYRQGCWLRSPPGNVLAMASVSGCILWVKRGHLSARGRPESN